MGNPIDVTLFEPEATLPERAHPDDAGADLTCSEFVDIPAGVALRIKTGVGVAIPKGHVGLILPRGSTIARHRLVVMTGVIDSGYTGEIMISIYNPYHKGVLIEPGTRIAQLLIVPVATPAFRRVDVLPASARGSAGFGSTGVGQ